MNVEIVPNAKSCQLGEGPHWSSTEGVLYYVDIPRGRVLRYDPLDGGSCNFVDIDGGKDPVSFVYIMLRNMQIRGIMEPPLHSLGKVPLHRQIMEKY